MRSTSQSVCRCWSIPRRWVPLCVKMALCFVLRSVCSAGAVMSVL
jgi:hypothetical protein